MNVNYSSGPFWMAFTRMRNSAMSRTVKRIKKRKKVVCTEAGSSLEIEALVGRMSWIAHG